jgi:hypothetical protein
MVYTTFEIITPNTFNLTYCRQVMFLYSFSFDLCVSSFFLELSPGLERLEREMGLDTTLELCEFHVNIQWMGQCFIPLCRDTQHHLKHTTYYWPLC